MRNNKPKNSSEIMDQHYRSEFVIEFASETGMTSCVALLKTILKDEGMKSKECPFTDEKAISLDDFEKEKAKDEKRQQCPTVDCVVALEHKRLLMVEMKFNVTSDKMKMQAEKLKSKHKSSCAILRCSPNYGCLNKMVVLLSDKEFGTRKSKLHRSLNNNPNYEILKISEFYDRYFSSKQQKETA